MKSAHAGEVNLFRGNLVVSRSMYDAQRRTAKFGEVLRSVSFTPGTLMKGLGHYEQ
jgi:hypothetical protein